MEKSKDELIAFIKDAIADPGSAAGNELNEILISCFNNAAGDSSMLTLEAMDELFTNAARVFGYNHQGLFKNDAAKKEARSELFNVISSNGHVTVDLWISWAKDHIAAKAPVVY